MNEAKHLANAVFNTYGFPILIMLIAALLLLETSNGLHVQTHNRWRRIFINVSTALPALALLRLFFIPLMIWLALKNQHLHVGLNYLYKLPTWVENVIAFVALDYLLYVWHVLTHKVPLLWRFHLVHHTDLDLDVTTAIRFHFGELLMFALFLGAAVLLTGTSPMVVLVYEIVFEACTNFHHSNWKLPVKLEQRLNLLIVTPRMHHLHHSIVLSEKNSNWGTIFSVWDRLHHTFSVNKTRSHVQVGEAAYQDTNELTILKLLKIPFQKLRKQG